MVNLESLDKQQQAKYWKWHGIIDSKPELYYGKNSDCALIPEEVLPFLAEDFEGIREYLKPEEKEKPKFKIISLKELNDYEPPVYTWRVQNLLQDKKIIIIGGPSAVFKSWLMLDLGLAVAKGNPFLDNFQVQQGGVLFIDRENSLPELQSRVEMVCKGRGISENNLPLYFLSEQSIRMDNFETREYLREIIVEKEIKLVIVDTYRRVIGFEENDANSVSLFFTDCLKPICEETGTSFVFIHHHKKGKSETDEKEMLRGSSDLVNFVDGIIQISRKGSKISVKQTKNRSGREIEPFELSVETDEQEYFKFNFLGEKQDTSMVGKVVETLLLWFTKTKKEQFETKEAREYCFSEGLKKQKFFEGIEELLKLGIIEKISRGMYKINQNHSDLELVHKSTHKSGGLVDYLPPSKSTSPKSPNGLNGLSGLKDKDSIFTKEEREAAYQ